MSLFKKIRAHLAEQIIRLIAYHVLFIFCAAGLVQYTQSYAEKHYQQPAKEVIANQNNRRKLAQIIVRDFHEMESGFRGMLLFKNPNRIKVLASGLDDKIKNISALLQLLGKGGTMTDSLLVNFADKDEIKEEITYYPLETETIYMENVNLAPKLLELKQMFFKMTMLLLEDVDVGAQSLMSENFELTMAVKQTEALLLRARESANRLFYDIRQVNIASQKEILRSEVKVKQILLGIRLTSNFLVIFLALLIALKIFKILQNQKKIQERNHWLSTVVEQSPSSIVITDTQGEVEYVNSFFEKQTGYRCTEIVGESTSLLKSGETPAEVFRQMWQTIASGGVWRGELCNQAKDGHLFYEEAVISPVFDSRGEITHFAAVKLDISEKKALAGRHTLLQVEQERLKSILGKAPVGIVITGRDDRIRWANDFVARITEFEQLENSDCRQLFYPVDGHHNGHDQAELFLCTKAGHRLPVITSAQQISWCDEEVTLTTFIDISARKKLEAELAQRSKFESVGYLAAGIAHEINTPIQFVKHNLQYLRDSFADLLRLLDLGEKLRQQALDGNVDGQTIEALARMREEIDIEFLATDVLHAIDDSLEGTTRVAGIVKTLKEFSHPASSERVPVDINHLIENAVNMTKNEWKYVADMALDLSPQGRMVPCLINELNQVILNLIMNARDAIVERQAEEPAVKGTITIRTKTIHGGVEIRVSDNGTGIPVDAQDKIFDPFFTTKDVGSGTGQGLSISRSIVVDKHQGSMGFETQPGGGTTLIVWLPDELES